MFEQTESIRFSRGLTAEASNRHTVAEIDLNALASNYRQLVASLSHALPMAVVKADAYGHGIEAVTRTLASCGCRHFGVATLSEAAALRSAGLKERIYLMGGFFPEQAKAIFELGVVPFIFDTWAISVINDCARASGLREVAVHLKVDTGATRLGVTLDDLDDAIHALRRADRLKLEGVCSLLADAGNPTSPVTNKQIEAFRVALNRLKEHGFNPSLNHIANSAAAVLRPDSHFDMVRIGLALYGLPPVPAVRERVSLKPVMTFRTRLLQVKNVPAGTGVSYGHTFVTARPSRIGILPVGYADGYRRGFQHGAEVIVRNRRAPVVGAVCMDLTMVDLTDVEAAAPGDGVILWGGSGENVISVNEIARLAQTISYELLCTVGKRVPRIYRDATNDEQ